MLLASEADLGDARLRERIAHVLRMRGKAVLLCETSAATADSDKNTSSQLPRDKLEQLLQKIFSAEETRPLIASTAWQSQPIAHAQFAAGQGTLVLISNAQPWQNSSFTAAETAPDATQAKWQRSLYHWLFEQP